MTERSTDGFVQPRAKASPLQKRERLWLNYGGDLASDPTSRAAQILGAPDHGGIYGDAPSIAQSQAHDAQDDLMETDDIVRGRRKENKSISAATAGSHEHQRSLPTELNENYEDGRDFNNLDEVAAPAPIAKDEETGRQEPAHHLEDRGIALNGTNIKQEKSQEEGVPTNSSQAKSSRFLSEANTVGYLVLFSLFGTLARLGLQALTFYPGAPVQTGLLWANVAGSFIMGFLSEDRLLFREALDRRTGASRHSLSDESPPLKTAHAAVKKTIPLYIGLTTGFCGSFTSFSSFERDAFFALANALPVPINHPSATSPPSPISQTLNVPRDGGYSFMALLAVAVTTIGLSLGALQIGAHLALALGKWSPSISLPFVHRRRRITEASIVILALLLWLAAIIMAAVPPDRPGGPLGRTSWSQSRWRGDALFALVFAPLGCLVRFYVSLHLNGKVASFPLGTFTVNILGSALEAMFIDLQHVPLGGRVGCQVLQGMNDGFCGCLTTVSTWVVEIKGLRLRHAYVYAGVSFAVGLLAFILITGSFLWTRGFAQLVCGV